MQICKQNQLSKKPYILRMYTYTVSKCYVSGLLVISKKIIVVDISFKICIFLDTLSSARILNLNYIHFQTDLLTRVSFLYEYATQSKIKQTNLGIFCGGQFWCRCRHLRETTGSCPNLTFTRGMARQLKLGVLL